MLFWGIIFCYCFCVHKGLIVKKVLQVLVKIKVFFLNKYILDLIQVPVDPLPEDRARRTLDRIDLLNKIREEIIHNEKLDERLKLCLPSLDVS